MTHHPSSSFHAGEIAVQSRAGVRAEAQRLCSVISTTIQPAAQEFLKIQQFVIASTIDHSHRSWASLLVGRPGFVRVLTDQTVQIDAAPAPGDPLLHNLLSNSQIGLLIIDLANRRRLRLNGRATVQSEGTFTVEIQQAFFNCPKYIQTRYLEPIAIADRQPPEIQTRSVLNEADCSWIAQADTFFIASAHPEQGADASHRGGYPGFVQAITAHQLIFPDYAGNNMFQTFGNLAINPCAGLLFVDFEQGHTLQLTGQAEVIWNAEQQPVPAPKTHRSVQFSVEQILETRNALPLRWQFGNYSSANPR